MSYEIKADYHQQFLFPPSLEDLVPSGHPARFIREFVDRLDLCELGFRESPGTEGRPHYSNDMLLKVWLYGYFHKIHSTRELEELCYRDLGVVWLTGMNYPDHNTLWRFFSNNRGAIREVFKDITEGALKSGLIGLTLHALDGTKIQAQVSTRTGWSRDRLEFALQDLDSSIDEIISEIESNSEGEDLCYSLPEELHDKERLQSKIEEILKEMKGINRNHLHPNDKDARMMKKGKTNEFCYNSQAVVDDKSGLIVAEDVTNDESDNNLLVPMIEEVEANLGDNADETVADAGYYSPPQLVKAESKGVDVMVNIKDQIEPGDRNKRFHKSKFKYDDEKDVFICPLGRELTFERIKDDRHKKYKLKIYRCHNKRDCPYSSDCSREKRGRSIEMGPHHGTLQRQIQKQKEPGNKEILAKRKQIVEPVFGIIKEVLKFRRFTVRGLENVKTQWSLICTTYNLRKLFKIWNERNLVIA
jgi:transposase